MARRKLATCVVAGVALAACKPAPVWSVEGGVPGTPPTQNAFVHQQGTALLDGAGAPVRLRAVNLGGWLLWEGWIWGAGFQSHSDVLGRLADLVGNDNALAFEQRVYERFITPDDIAAIAGLGFNAVRVPISRRLLEDDAAPFVYRDQGWAVLDRLVDACEANGVYAILDLHSAPGGQSSFFVADPGETKLWDDSLAEQRTVALWRALAERYRDRAIVAGYDLLNEPDPPSAKRLEAVYREIATAIREVDPRHLLIVEGANFAQDFSVFSHPVAENQAYSFHMYTWWGDPRRDQLAQYHRTSESDGIPMWNGEFGENSVEMLGSTQALFEDPSYGLVGSAFWPWKKVPNGSAYLVGITRELPRWKKLMAWVANPTAPKPAPEEASAAMDDFLEAAQIGSCDVNAELAAALSPR